MEKKSKHYFMCLNVVMALIMEGIQLILNEGLPNIIVEKVQNIRG